MDIPSDCDRRVSKPPPTRRGFLRQRSGNTPVRRRSSTVLARLMLLLPDQQATRALGRRLAGLIRPEDVIALRGVLGSGKTELARALIRARAGADIEVPSPSYTLVQDYRFPDLLICHIDLYRIRDPAELLELGLDAPAAGEAWLIEWPERADAVLPADRLDLELRPGDMPDARIADLNAGPSWIERLDVLRGA
jgi:tRNA threonylcarbamoyl adenosine modification protein YjeE